MRSFDPRRVGRLECETWVTYYRREWGRFLLAAIAVTRHAFALPWRATLRGAWLVLRANHRPAALEQVEDGVDRLERAVDELALDPLLLLEHALEQLGLALQRPEQRPQGVRAPGRRDRPDDRLHRRAPLTEEVGSIVLAHGCILPAAPHD